MNIVDICEYKYPGEIFRGNIVFKKLDDEILIESWSVESEEKPSEQSLIDYGQANTANIKSFLMAKSGAVAIQSHIDKTAREKDYDNGFACATYCASSNQEWKSEAEAFVSWRDSVWSYALGVYDDVQSEAIEPPSLEDFISNAPVMSWPE